MDADGEGEPEKITGPETEDYDPTYSPDGESIVYGGEHETGEGEISGDLYEMDAAGGSEPRALTDPLPGIRRFDAVYSPDSTKLAYVSDRRGDYDVYLMQLDGTSQRNLTRDEQDPPPSSANPPGAPSPT